MKSSAYPVVAVAYDTISKVSKIILKQGYETISLPKNYLNLCPKIAIGATSS